MLGLLTAMDQMRTTLLTADAPARQIAGVDAWRSAIDIAVSIGSQYPRPAGMSIADTAPLRRGGRGPARRTRFLHGQATHAAWRDLCVAVVDALTQQHNHAVRLANYWLARARAADSPNERAYAVQQAEIAAAWGRAALEAASTGRDLTADEDAIQVPVGRVIRKVGLAEVATDKRYHQRGARR